MPNTKLSPVALIALLALAVTACGGRAPAKVTAQPTAAPRSIDPLEALRGSAKALSADVQSGRSTFSWKVERDGFSAQGNGTYVVQVPGNLEIDEHYQGQGSVPTPFKEANDTKLLILGESAFLSSPALGSGWLQAAPRDLGPDWIVLQRLIAARSPIDYTAITSKLSAPVTALGHESIDGVDRLHLSTTIDAGTVMDALADAYGSQGQVMIAHRFSGSVPLDIWLEPDTMLPRRIKVDGRIIYLGASTQVQVTVDFKDLNRVTAFSNPPRDAKPISQLRQ